MRVTMVMEMVLEVSRDDGDGGVGGNEDSSNSGYADRKQRK